MTVFADAFFYVALINRRDGYHARAAEFASSYRGDVVTTEWVMTEVADALAASQARPRVLGAFHVLRTDPGTRIVAASPELFASGLSLYGERPDKMWSLTDCISFVVMSDQHLSDALTADHHFRQAGFVPIFADTYSQ